MCHWRTSRQGTICIAHSIRVGKLARAAYYFASPPSPIRLFSLVLFFTRQLRFDSTECRALELSEAAAPNGAAPAPQMELAMHHYSADRPLRRFFSGLAEHTFVSDLGVADPPLIDYLSELLSRFIAMDVI